MPTRRDVLTALASTGLAVVGAPMINRGRHRLSGQSRGEYSTRAIALATIWKHEKGGNA